MAHGRRRGEQLRDRRRYQRTVARLLQQIDAQTHRLRLLEAAGVHGAALGALERDLERTREDLAAAIRARRGDARPAPMNLRVLPGPTSVRDHRSEGAAA